MFSIVPEKCNKNPAEAKTKFKMAASQLISVSDAINENLIKSDKEINYCAQCIDSVDENMNNKYDNMTEVQKFYNGKNVLITGATGKTILLYFGFPVNILNLLSRI